MENLVRLLALYLPQFHPIPENDLWWGKGFTEWTNTAKAKPLFRGHYQPHVPADLGFYDLRVAETREQQAAMARAYGIEGFCYYHYWFAGRRLLERPFEEVVQSGKPDFPFCLCWANETWTGIWHGAPNRVLLEQTYPGIDDHAAHFRALLPAFCDSRYVRVNGKPFFAIYKPMHLPDSCRVTDLWREMALEAGLPGLHLVGMSVEEDWIPAVHGFDAASTCRMPLRRPWVSRRRPIQWGRRKYEEWAGLPTTYSYAEVLETLMPMRVAGHDNYPCIVHAWDNSPRSGRNGLVLHESTPELFRQILRKAIEVSRHRPPEQNLVLLKSWNEWAEGNHLEPDLRFGKAYLEVIREECGFAGPREQPDRGAVVAAGQAA
jgi:hypothetical protein